jgi:hypothetical protein
MNRLTPDITKVRVVRHGVLELTFADGLGGEVDVLDRIRGRVRTGLWPDQTAAAYDQAQEPTRDFRDRTRASRRGRARRTTRRPVDPEQFSAIGR